MTLKGTYVMCIQNVDCEEGSECSITTETVCNDDMCDLEYRGHCTGRSFVLILPLIITDLRITITILQIIPLDI